MKIEFNNLKGELFEILNQHGFNAEKSEIISSIISETTLDGVYSHGVNRFPLLIELVREGVIDKDAEPALQTKFGVSEQWDGYSGPGITNARFAMNRAIQIAKEFGIGFVSLSNTNHWLRGGSYGWQAADAGMIGMCFTNTKPNMPPWGGITSKIGNNPFIIAVPREDGHIVLDMALSQFSFGKIHEYKLKGQKLPYAGGFDEHGILTSDPTEILKEERGLPIGYWKGSGMSMMLDLMVSLLSGGINSNQIGKKKHETGLSQVFMCWDLSRFGDTNMQKDLIEDIVSSIHSVETINKGESTYFPGEKTMNIRKRQMKEGITINDEIWGEIIGLKVK